MDQMYNLESLLKRPVNPAYGAFFNSVIGGFTTDSRLMLIPMDDHIVHRGDGVFEAIKVAHGKPYLLTPHMERMFRSADKIDMKLYFSRERMIEIVEKTWAHAAPKLGAGGVIRAFLSRGPGNFGVSPTDTVGSQFYVVATSLAQVSPEKRKRGVKIGRAQLPTKPSWLAQAKTCNYLPNVMQKRDAELRGLDYVIGVDPHGFVAESATENLVIVNKHGALVRPPTDFILEGCTMNRALELAKNLMKPPTGQTSDPSVNSSVDPTGNPAHGLTEIKTAGFTETDLIESREVLMMGSTFDVLAVTSYDGKPIGDGVPGPIGKKLLELIEKDQRPDLASP